MKKKLTAVVLLGVLTFGVSLAHHWHPDYDRSGETFVYDANLATYRIIGTVHTYPGEAWDCPLTYHGYILPGMEPVIVSYNKPDNMLIDCNDYNFAWQPADADVGLHIIDFHVGWYRTYLPLDDPNYGKLRVIPGGSGTVFILVDEPLQLGPIGGCTR